MADEDVVVIRRRLLTRATTLGRPGLKKCTDNLLSLLDLLADESVDERHCKQDLDSLLWELEQVEFEANKTDLVSFTSQRELEAYETLDADIDASIAKVSQEIEQLKSEVQGEKLIRAYKEEYESIARVINELPSRSESAAAIAIEEKRASEAREAIGAVDAKLDLRTKQFSLLLNTIQNLKATLDEDVEMEEEELKQNEADDDDMDGKDAATPLRTPVAAEEDEDMLPSRRTPSSP